jgi:hypothetical protein
VDAKEITSVSRRHDIDWVRVFATLTVFLFHCARFFDEQPWHVKNSHLSYGMTVLVAILSQWIMPLFFVLSAYSVYYALGRRNFYQFVSDRVRRLLVPFVFGILVLVPPQVYIERVTQAQFSGSFLQFLPQYFVGWYGFGGNFAWMGLHLWYLGLLFIYSLFAYPVFRYLGREQVRRLISRVVDSIGVLGSLLLPILPLVLVEMLVSLNLSGIGRRDFGGWSILTYLVFFVLGYVMAGDEQLQEGIERYRVVALVGGLVVTTIGYFLVEAGYETHVLFSLPRAINSWLWIMAIVGFGSRHLRSGNNFLTYANQAVLPFYVLHQTVIVVVGFFLVDWSAGIVHKYIILALVSFIIVLILYELPVKRIWVNRRLFGMK